MPGAARAPVLEATPLASAPVGLTRAQERVTQARDHMGRGKAEARGSHTWVEWHRLVARACRRREYQMFLADCGNVLSSRRTRDCFKSNSNKNVEGTAVRSSPLPTRATCDRYGSGHVGGGQNRYAAHI